MIAKTKASPLVLSKDLLNFSADFDHKTGTSEGTFIMI
jgi:hypothetical protein